MHIYIYIYTLYVNRRSRKLRAERWEFGGFRIADCLYYNLCDYRLSFVCSSPRSQVAYIEPLLMCRCTRLQWEWWPWWEYRTVRGQLGATNAWMLFGCWQAFWVPVDEELNVQAHSRAHHDAIRCMAVFHDCDEDTFYRIHPLDVRLVTDLSSGDPLLITRRRY